MYSSCTSRQLRGEMIVQQKTIGIDEDFGLPRWWWNRGGPGHKWANWRWCPCWRRRTRSWWRRRPTPGRSSRSWATGSEPDLSDRTQTKMKAMQQKKMHTHKHKTQNTTTNTVVAVKLPPPRKSPEHSLGLGESKTPCTRWNRLRHTFPKRIDCGYVWSVHICVWLSIQLALGAPESRRNNLTNLNKLVLSRSRDSILVTLSCSLGQPRIHWSQLGGESMTIAFPQHRSG